MKTIAVYCGASHGADPLYAEAARELARTLVEHNIGLVYGGGKVGLMGVIADEVLRLGGEATGVIPRALVDKEFAKRDCTELHIVESMHDRKRLMAERAGAFLALAGGIGTFEELFEVWTWRQLGYHDKPVGILDTSGYYQPLLGFLGQSVREGFMNDWQMQLVQVGSEPGALLRSLVEGSTAPSAQDLSQI